MYKKTVAKNAKPLPSDRDIVEAAEHLRYTGEPVTVMGVIEALRGRGWRISALSYIDAVREKVRVVLEELSTEVE